MGCLTGWWGNPLFLFVSALNHAAVRVDLRVKTAFSGQTTRKTCRIAGRSAGQNSIFRLNDPQNMPQCGSIRGIKNWLNKHNSKLHFLLCRKYVFTGFRALEKRYNLDQIWGQTWGGTLKSISKFFKCDSIWGQTWGYTLKSRRKIDFYSADTTCIPHIFRRP